MLLFMKVWNLLFLLILLSGAVTAVVYIAVGLIHKLTFAEPEAPQTNRYAAVIAARNEEAVIPGLIGSLRRQRYPAELLDIYVVADNCTDGTAAAARAAGATAVYTRRSDTEIGKGYALDHLFRRVLSGHSTGEYAGYFIFDADNIVEEHFVAEMNKTICRGGYDAVTCYRSSRNFGANWISAGYSIWFLRQSRFLNFPRSILGLSCAVGGTGFFVSDALIRHLGGWPYHLLTEDIEFSAHCAVEDRTIGYCDRAVIFDEQPTAFRQSWVQRLRWSKGFYQVDARYGPALAREGLRGGRHGISCIEMLFNLMPGLFAGAAACLFCGLSACIALTVPVGAGRLIAALAARFLQAAGLGYYLSMLSCGLITVLTEWRRIPAANWKKLCYLPLFPLFMLTYLPIAVAALFQKVEWKPIRHTPAAESEQV